MAMLKHFQQFICNLDDETRCKALFLMSNMMSELNLRVLSQEDLINFSEQFGKLIPVVKNPLDLTALLLSPDDIANNFLEKLYSDLLEDLMNTIPGVLEGDLESSKKFLSIIKLITPLKVITHEGNETVIYGIGGIENTDCGFALRYTSNPEMLMYQRLLISVIDHFEKTYETN